MQNPAEHVLCRCQPVRRQPAQRRTEQLEPATRARGSAHLWCAGRLPCGAQDVYLAGADLANADLRSSNLTGAVITNADLRDADLSKTNLNNVLLTGSDLTDTYLRGATTNGDILAGTIRCRTTRPDGTIDNTSCAGPMPSTTTTTKPSPTTTRSTRPTPPTTRPTPPTTRPTPPTTTPGPPPPCTLSTLQAAYAAKYGLPPDGTTFTINACVGGYAGTNLDNPDIGSIFVAYQAQGSNWLALNEGSAGVCDGLGIPPAVAEQIGCV
jgi:Pentapeptide repeats (8 copies)